MKIIAIVSGGLDSVTMAHLYSKAKALDMILTFDYGQRHRIEIDYAERCAVRLNVPWRVISLNSVTPLLHGSALSDMTVAVPEGHYEAESMKLTVVPNRNSMMLAIATAAAVSRKANAVALAVHAGDHAIYPDCRSEFIDAFQKTMRLANEGFIDPGFQILAPFVTWSKAEIVQCGFDLGVDFADTWSCYKGAHVHCGRCGTCVERREAFDVANVTDPTVYGDWPVVV